MRYSLLLLLFFAVPAFGATRADTTFAAVDSIVSNRPVLRDGYLVIVIKATNYSRFLADRTTPVATADPEYVLLYVPLSGATGAMLDSLKLFARQCEASGGYPVYQVDGSTIVGQWYMRWDKAINFLKSLAGY